MLNVSRTKQMNSIKPTSALSSLCDFFNKIFPTFSEVIGDNVVTDNFASIDWTQAHISFTIIC